MSPSTTTATHRLLDEFGDEELIGYGKIEGKNREKIGKKSMTAGQRQQHVCGVSCIGGDPAIKPHFLSISRI